MLVIESLNTTESDTRGLIDFFLFWSNFTSSTTNIHIIFIASSKYLIIMTSIHEIINYD